MVLTCIQNRDGQIADVLANDLVPGDIVHFGVGDRIPADCRLTAVCVLRLCTLVFELTCLLIVCWIRNR
jgi:hypothetical protein